MRVIAHVHTDFPDKFGVPRQSGLVPLLGRIVFEPPYGNPDAFRGLERYSHIWVLWRFDGFDSDAFSPTVRPPRLGGNRRMGVFATRSPHRPNPIGISVLRLLQVVPRDGAVELLVSGVDMVDGTAVFDVKPYLPQVDSVPDATGGFSAEHLADPLTVTFAEGLSLSPDLADQLRALIAADPRPHYHEDGRVYGMRFRGFEVKFTVHSSLATILSVVPDGTEA
jgi:tRNA-Thr(GGU) m(6)t(6)A37 methyltransferase TsaA